MVVYSSTPCTYTPTEPSAIDRLNTRINKVTSNLNRLNEEITNLDDALCEFSTDVDIRVSDVEDALCELSEEA